MCAETIQLEAKVCRFCGARFKLEFQGYCTSCHAKRETDESGNCRVCGKPLMDMHVKSELIHSAPVQNKRPAEATEMIRPHKTGARRALITCLVGILLILGGLFIAFYFTGGSELMKPVETATFDTIHQYEKERRVRIEGSLHLPFSSNCDDNCALELVDYDDPDKVLIIFVDVGAQNGIPEPNHMVRLPSSYNKDTLKVGLNGGGVAGNGASVILTGSVCETTTGKLCLSVDQIDQGSIPPTPLPTATPLPVHADFSNVCSHIGAPVIIQGRIRPLNIMMWCDPTCTLTLADLGNSGTILYFYIARGGLANQMENLPNKYQNSDLKIHTNDGLIVGVDDVVIIQGVVGASEDTWDKSLECKISVQWISKAP